MSNLTQSELNESKLQDALSEFVSYHLTMNRMLLDPHFKAEFNCGIVFIETSEKNYAISLSVVELGVI